MVECAGKICIKDNNGNIINTTRKVKYKEVEDSDINKAKEVFVKWKEICKLLNDLSRRKVNLPEGISEIIIAKQYNYVFLNQKSLSAGGKKISTSFDCFDKVTGDKIQIKACSVEKDLSSFGPKSQFDKLLFADFYNVNDAELSFKVYDIPIQTLKNWNVNGGQTFVAQQLQGRRPRLSLKEFIEKNNNNITVKTFKIDDMGNIIES